MEQHSPDKSMLWPGAVAATVVHAVAIARMPFLAHEQSWHEETYSVQNSEGSRGTVAFGVDPATFVGVFYHCDSTRAREWQHDHSDTQAVRLVADAPEHVGPLVEKALQYVLQEADGKTVPVLTAAFWTDPQDPRVCASEAWERVLEHGACLVQRQFLPVADAFDQWVQDYDLGSEQAALAKEMTDIRLSRCGHIQLPASVRKRIVNVCSLQEGLDACCDALAELGLMICS